MRRARTRKGHAANQIRARSAHHTCSLFTMHCSLFTKNFESSAQQTPQSFTLSPSSLAIRSACGSLRHFLRAVTVFAGGQAAGLGGVDIVNGEAGTVKIDAVAAVVQAGAIEGNIGRALVHKGLFPLQTGFRATVSRLLLR